MKYGFVVCFPLLGFLGFWGLGFGVLWDLVELKLWIWSSVGIWRGFARAAGQ